MTYKKWEWELKCLLKGMSQSEIKEITDYYSEIYGDKKEAGFDDIEILMEFGTPEECAERIKKEYAENVADPAVDSKEKKGSLGAISLERFHLSRLKLSPIVWVIVSVFLLIPAAIIAVCTAVIFALASISGAVIGIGGAVTVIYSLVQLIVGMPFSAVIAIFGMGLAMVGAGVIFTIIFFYLTKYTVSATVKVCKYLYNYIIKEKK